jgi:hypothetical protein
MVVVQSLIDGGENGLCDLLAPVDVVAAVGEDFRLDDRHNAVRLADGSIARQNVGVLLDRLVAGGVLAW